MPQPIASTTSSSAWLPVDSAGVGLGHGERDREQRDAQAVVEPALDVQALADPRRQACVGDDGLPERGVGRGEHDREHDRLRPRDVGQHEHAGDCAGHDRQRQTDAQQPYGYRELASQGVQVDARRVGEQHDDERGLGERR